MLIKDSTSIRKLNLNDFKKAVSSQPPSVSRHTIKEFDDWRKEKG
jgi:SpoVK/Ycf46/Vps4 family AAA+-type ATPase